MTRIILILFLSLAPALAALPAEAANSNQARLRKDVTVADAVIRLGDLFENAGRHAETVVGKAPDPGKRALYSSRHVAAVARAHGLAWRPKADNRAVSITRSGQRVPHEAIASALREGLSRAGAGEDLRIILANREVALFQAENERRDIEVEILKFDPRTARFEARLQLASANGGRGLRVSGRAHPVAEVPVLSNSVPSGAIVRAEDLEYRQIFRNRLAGDALTDTRSIVGKAARRHLRAGTPLRANDLRQPIVIAKGTLVTVAFEAPGLQLSTTARALEDASIGEPIRVSNLHSKRIVEGVVVTPSLVRVSR